MSDPEQLKKHEINEDKNTEPTKTEYDTLTEVKPFNAEQARKNVTEAKAKIAEEKRIAEEQAQIAKEQARNRRASQEKYRQVQEQRKEEERQRKEKEKRQAEQAEKERLEKEIPKVFTTAINEKIKEASKNGKNQVDFTYSQTEEESYTEWHSGTGYDDIVVNEGKFEHRYDGFTGLELDNSSDEFKKRGNDSLHFLWTWINRPIISDVLGVPNEREEAFFNQDKLERWAENEFLLDKVSSTLTNLAEDYAKNGFRVYLADINLEAEDKKLQERLGIGTPTIKKKENKIETIRKISWGEGEEPGVVREEKGPEPEVEQETSETVKEEVTVQDKTSKRPSLRGIFKKKNNN